MSTADAVRRSEQNFRTIIEQAPISMCVSSGDRLVYMNKAMLQYLGYSSGDPLRGPTLAQLSDEIIHPDDRPRTREAFRGLFATLSQVMPDAHAGVVRIDDVRLFRTDGVLLCCDMHGVAILHDDAPALVTYLHDRTEQRLAQERMRLADRMSSLGTLAAGVAHEINNPLAFVIANFEYISQRLFDPNCRDDLALPVEDTRIGLHRIRQIVQSLRAFSRREEDRVVAVDVIKVVESCIEMAQDHFRDGSRLVRAYADVPPVRANDARLGQVFLSLLLNAADAVAGGASPRQEITVGVERAGDWVAIEIRDTGVGIPPENLPRVFDPFFTTKLPGQGIGLGLSVSHGIVTALGGTIEISSAVGKGTSALVRLPVAREP